MKDSIEIQISDGINREETNCSTFCMVTVDKDGGVDWGWKNAPENSPAEILASGTILAGAMAFALTRLLKALDKANPLADVQMQARKTYARLQDENMAKEREVQE